MSNSRPAFTQTPTSACDILRAMFNNPVKSQPGFLNELARANSACDLGLVASPLSQPDNMLYTYPSRFEHERAAMEKQDQSVKAPTRRK